MYSGRPIGNSSSASSSTVARSDLLLPSIRYQGISYCGWRPGRYVFKTLRVCLNVNAKSSVGFHRQREKRVFTHKTKRPHRPRADLKRSPIVARAAGGLARAWRLRACLTILRPMKTRRITAITARASAPIRIKGK